MSISSSCVADNETLVSQSISDCKVCKGSRHRSSIAELIILSAHTESQPAFDPKADPRPAMLPAPVPHEDTIGTPEDQLVEDMLSSEFWKLWSETGMRNRAAFEKVFRPVRSATTYVERTPNQ